MPSDQPLDELPASTDYDWTVASSLLVADQLTNRALEEHLLRMHYTDSGTVEELNHIDESIKHHKEIIDQLELAKKILNEQQEAEGEERAYKHG